MHQNIPRYPVYMLIILPPSETKAHGGTGQPLDFSQLSFPQLHATRQEIAAELQSLPVDEAMEVLKLSEKLRGEAESNQGLFTTPTMPAVLRYTGVLFDALDAPSLPTWDRLAIGDALFGVLRASDPIPHCDSEHVIKPGIGIATLKDSVAFQMMGDPETILHPKVLFMLALTEPHGNPLLQCTEYGSTTRCNRRCRENRNLYTWCRCINTVCKYKFWCRNCKNCNKR